MDLQDQLHAFERFDPSKMVTEVHEMSETLIKIRAGTLSNEEFDSIHFDPEVFHGDKGSK
jgi:hypothetical protein